MKSLAKYTDSNSSILEVFQDEKGFYLTDTTSSVKWEKKLFGTLECVDIEGVVAYVGDIIVHSPANFHPVVETEFTKATTVWVSDYRKSTAELICQYAR